MLRKGGGGANDRSPQLDVGFGLCDQVFSLELKVPNAQTLAAIQESRTLIAQRQARFASADKLLADFEQFGARSLSHPPVAAALNDVGQLLALSFRQNKGGVARHGAIFGLATFECQLTHRKTLTRRPFE